MRDESASIVMISGANSDWNKFCKSPDEGPDFSGLFHFRFGAEHVDYITGNKKAQSGELVGSANEASWNSVMKING